MEENSGLKSQLAADSARIAGPAATSLGSSPLGTGTSIYLTVNERKVINHFKSIKDGSYAPLNYSQKIKSDSKTVRKLLELGLIEQQSPKMGWWFRLTEKGKKFRFPKKWACSSVRLE